MGVLTIKGGRRLEGELRVHGAKNSVLPVLAATVLGGRETLLLDCPRLRDVETMLAILRSLGCRAVHEDDKISVYSEGITGDTIPDYLMRELRSSVVFMGSILARTGHVKLSYPGGCMLGARPIDLHLAAMRKLGAEVRETGADIECRAERLVGTDIPLSLPSVGATENIMLAATAAEGTTRIINAAREPEIEDLQTYLRASGAVVYGAGSSIITIEGGSSITPAVHRIMPDRIEAATFLAAAASAGGSIRLTNVCPEHLPTVTELLSEAGCAVTRMRGEIHITANKRLHGVSPIRTSPYPGFPTDAQAPIMGLMAGSDGVTVFVENIFESRYRHVGELKRMGANIETEGRVAVVRGVERLFGEAVTATDLRGGAALIIAGLAASGETKISGSEHIERGYDGIEAALASVGADIRRVPEEE